MIARAVCHALDGLVDAWSRDPELDIDHYTDQLLRLFAAATRTQR